MSGIRLPSIKHLTSKHPRRLCLPQRRWARVHDVRFVATQQADNVTDRYREKLHQKARERGLEDIGKLKEVYRDEILDLKKKAAVSGATAPLSTQTSSQPAQASSQSGWPKPPPPPQPQVAPTARTAQPIPSTPKAPPGVKTLSSFLDMSKVATLPNRELEALWRLRFAHVPNTLCAAMPTSMYETIARTAKRHPYFILPGLPPAITDEASDSASTSASASASSATSSESDSSGKVNPMTGAPIHILQWTFPSATTTTVLFTHLAEYKLRGTHSQPHTTLTHHTDFVSDPSKSLVLCQGSVTPDRGVSVEEGKWLIMQLQRFYCVGEEVEEKEEGTSKIAAEMKRRRRRLVEMFGRGDEAFRIEELVEEAERLG